MKLRELLANIAVLETNTNPETEITGVAYDSRKVTLGSLFVAISGFATDGNRFIPMAMEKGAAVVVTAKKPEGDVPYVLVESDRKALAILGVNYFGHPAESMTMVGITGTNGKTSSTLLLKHVIETVLQGKVGLIGTMENRIGDEVIPTERTTPESFELQQLFGRMRDAGCTHVVMEVSSHAISLDRVAGVHYDVAAFTNLTEDHLDFHKTMESYCDAKAELFSRCDRAVLNCDDPWFERMCRLAKSLEDAAAALATAQGVKGRVEVVPTPGKDYTVLIDYAHTPDGLENVLSSVKDYCKGRLIALFGCGGDRDRTKRPIMGRIGAELADIAIITSDNPRTEVPSAIIADIVAGIPETAGKYEVIENRVEAIHHAMDIAQKDDIIVLAGKGHETYQEICGVKNHLDEREVVADYLRK